MKTKVYLITLVSVILLTTSLSAGLNEDLFDAVNKGDIKKATALIKKGADVNAKNKYHMTPLHVAASWPGDRINIVKLLIKANANINAKTIRGSTPLDTAYGRRKAYKESGVGVEGVDKLIKLLKKNGAKSGIDLNKNLFKAVEKGNIKKVAALIKKGANVNAKDDWRRSSLYTASGMGHLAIVKLLIQKGADVNLKNEFDGTALHEACSEGHSNIVNVLLKKGADVNAITRARKRTPLHRVMNGKENKERIKIVKALLAKGAKVISEQETMVSCSHPFISQQVEGILSSQKCFWQTKLT
ncbi:MAG: hypothetical protein IEMM0008_1582 [bacterium]|nr:MAG: hypothetical protein IEMM0008_1582 [bacterium]